MTTTKNRIRYLLLVGSLLMLNACASGLSATGSQKNVFSSENCAYKVGKPYKVLGAWYYPEEDFNYSEVGVASWYGKDFHAKYTANGEIYDMNTLTAAHRTLPLPSIVKVTNLENGRSVILRVNDRGPFAKSRIIDISKHGAQILGFQNKGTTKVRVELMPEESKKLRDAILNNKDITIPIKQPNQKTIQIASQPLPKLATSSPKANSQGHYFVQAGSFSQQNIAEDLGRKLSEFGSSNTIPADVKGKRYYRVRLGPYAKEADAEATLTKVQAYGVSTATVIKD